MGRERLRQRQRRRTRFELAPASEYPTAPALVAKVSVMCKGNADSTIASRRYRRTSANWLGICHRGPLCSLARSLRNREVLEVSSSPSHSEPLTVAQDAPTAPTPNDGHRELYRCRSSDGSATLVLSSDVALLRCGRFTPRHRAAWRSPAVGQGWRPQVPYLTFSYKQCRFCIILPTSPYFTVSTRRTSYLSR